MCYTDHTNKYFPLHCVNFLSPRDKMATQGLMYQKGGTWKKVSKKFTVRKTQTHCYKFLQTATIN